MDLHATTRLRRLGARRRFLHRKLNRLFESDDASAADIARAVDEWDGLGRVLGGGAAEKRSTQQWIVRLGAREAARRINRYFGRAARTDTESTSTPPPIR